MIRPSLLLTLRQLVFPFGVALVALLVWLPTVSVRSAQNPAPPRNGAALSALPLVSNQALLTSNAPKADPKKSNLEKTKTDAAELSTLADQLRDELNKMNVNVLALDVIKKTESVEKLAKKIKEEANGH